MTIYAKGLLKKLIAEFGEDEPEIAVYIEKAKKHYDPDVYLDYLFAWHRAEEKRQ